MSTAAEREEAVRGFRNDDARGTFHAEGLILVMMLTAFVFAHGGYLMTFPETFQWGATLLVASLLALIAQLYIGLKMMNDSNSGHAAYRAMEEAEGPAERNHLRRIRDGIIA